MKGVFRILHILYLNLNSMPTTQPINYPHSLSQSQSSVLDSVSLLTGICTLDIPTLEGFVTPQIIQGNGIGICDFDAKNGLRSGLDIVATALLIICAEIVGANCIRLEEHGYISMTCIAYIWEYWHY
ncbi:hypothetical protein VNO77_42711 [Canavalia gladiata]|uniref:Uncharacterized protein n=1 Tax=Canavalia gladiata TaxID=3824 RepID=A0AAN9JVR4_CANGL